MYDVVVEQNNTRLAYTLARCKKLVDACCFTLSPFAVLWYRTGLSYFQPQSI